MARSPISNHRFLVWGGSESTFAAGPSSSSGPAATDGYDFVTIDAPFQTRGIIPNADMTGYSTKKQPTTGSYDPVNWSVTLQLRGSGTAATAPDFAHLLKAASLTETVGGSDVSYTRSESGATSAWNWSATADGSIGICHAGIGIGEINVPDLGSDNTRIQFSGQAALASVMYQCNVGTGGITNVATSLPLETGHGWVVAGTAPLYISVSEGGNTEVMKVTAFTAGSPDAVTVTRNILSAGAFAFTTAATISAYVPSQTKASTAPISAYRGGFTVNLASGGANNMEFTRANLSVKTGVEMWDKEFGNEQRAGLLKTSLPDDAVRLNCDVVYTLGTAGTDGVARLHYAKQAQTDVAWILTCGSVTGNRLVITASDGNVADISAPLVGDGPMRGTVIFGAYDASTPTGTDVTLKFD
jgi:hypothetical protein